MFVRWKRRASQWGRQCSRRRPFREAFGEEERAARGASLDAVLVKSERTEGKVKQRFVAHLATVKERNIPRPCIRACFWREVGARLDGLGIEGAERERIEAKLAEKVNRPTEAEQAEAKATSQATHERIMALRRV